MATSEEVTMSVGDVMMIKADSDGDAEDPNKTQVILQLQPITTGYVCTEAVGKAVCVCPPVRM